MSHKINLQEVVALMLVLLAAIGISLLLLGNPPVLRLGPVMRSETDTAVVEPGARPAWTQEDVAAIEREYGYTTAADVATGKRDADRYWLTHHTIYEVAAAEREFTYTTPENLAAGKRAADRYWLTHHTIYEVAAAEREFTYTTPENVQKGKTAAEAFWREWEATH